MRYFSIVFLLGLGMTACGSKAAQPNATASTTSTDSVDCSADKRITAYSNNMVINGNTYSIALSATDPNEPSTGLNTWAFKVQDQNGVAVTDANVTITPWMPDHGHGPSVLPQVTNAAGAYSATDVDLFMPGVWQLTFTVDANNVTDKPVVYFCIQG